MTKTDCAEYFLGANTPLGFHSYFETACPAADGWKIYIIKGGPGTGKSTLMKHICAEADKKGLDCEHIYCSSDPASLDGIIIPELKSAVFDGTAPHVLEPAYPGACENIINLGTAWSTAALRSAREDIINLSKQCSAHHTQARHFLSCADSFRKNTASLAAESMDYCRIERTADRLIAKYTGKIGKNCGSERLRLLSAVTPLGVKLFENTLTLLCGQIIPIKDNYFSPAAALMAQLRERLLDKGHNITTCFCSQSPDSIEHIIIPEQRLAFSVCSSAHCAECTERSIHTERFMPADFINKSRKRISFNRKNISSFTELAAAEMRHAKAVHDKLEQSYISAMNFDAAEEIARKYCTEILHS